MNNKGNTSGYNKNSSPNEKRYKFWIELPNEQKSLFKTLAYKRGIAQKELALEIIQSYFINRSKTDKGIKYLMEEFRLLNSVVTNNQEKILVTENEKKELKEDLVNVYNKIEKKDRSEFLKYRKLFKIILSEGLG